MSITPALQASARSAYRSLLRASALTFSGDERVNNAFRQKARAETISGRSEMDPVAYEVNVRHAREVAEVLRTNIVQAAKVENDGKEVWRLRMTEHTELGSNDTIQKRSPPSQKRCQATPQVGGVDGVAWAQGGGAYLPPTRSLNYSALKKAHLSRIVPVLLESDLEESFVRGSGPGGQSINKTQNNVQILHKPTGMRVSCQETRSLEQNRKLARRLLLEKLDKIQNPGLSKEQMKRARQIERERQRRKKAKKKHKLSMSV